MKTGLLSPIIINSVAILISSALYLSGDKAFVLEY
jgi:hypothetical protein